MTEKILTSTNSSKRIDNTLACFWLDDAEYGLFSSELREVAPFPSEVMPVPKSPPYLLGLFRLRNLIIPLVDMKAYFFADQSVAPAKTGHIAIIENQGALVGFVFSKTSDILRVNSQESANIEFLDSSEKGKLLAGIYKDPSSGRFIQILNSTSLMELEGVPRFERSANLSNDLQTTQDDDSERIIVVREDRGLYGLRIKEVIEITDLVGLTVSPVDSDLVLGSLSIRGAHVPILSFDKLIGNREAIRKESDGRALIIEVEGYRLALRVDEIVSLTSYSKKDLQGLPQVNRSKNIYSGSIALSLNAEAENSGQEDILVIDRKKLIELSQLSEMTQQLKKTYPQEVETKQTELSTDRVTLPPQLVFRCSFRMGFPISEVVEVIKVPGKLSPLSGFPPFVLGGFHLRKIFVTVVSLRKLYGIRESAAEGSSPANDKAFVIKLSDGSHVGILIDQIDDIWKDIQKNKASELSAKAFDAPKALSEDLHWATVVPKKGDLLLIDPENLKKRVQQSIGS